jgi:hypothetical protein
MSCCTPEQEQLLRDAERIIYGVLRRLERARDEDLAQEVRAALVLDVQRFDPALAPWWAYAWRCARHAAFRVLREERAAKRGFGYVPLPLEEVVVSAPEREEPQVLNLAALTPAERRAVDGIARGETALETALRTGSTKAAVDLARRAAVKRLRQAHGVVADGRSALNRRLTHEDHERVRALHASGATFKAIARAVRSNRQTVADIVQGAA